MLMFRSSLEKIIEANTRLSDAATNLREKVQEKDLKIVKLENELAAAKKAVVDLQERQAFEIDVAKHELAKTMQEKLIESDLKRTEAVAKYNCYAEMDTKEERIHIQKMLEKAIDSLGKATQVVVSGQK